MNFNDCALIGRSLACFHVGRLIKMTPSKKAVVITNNAIQKGFVSNRKPITGQQLTAFAKARTGENVPAWVAVSCVDLLMHYTDFVPENDNDWAVFAFAVTKQLPLVTDVSLLENLIPHRYDKELAIKWLTIAVNAKPRNDLFLQHARQADFNDKSKYLVALLNDKESINARELSFMLYRDFSHVKNVLELADGLDNVIVSRDGNSPETFTMRTDL